MPAPHLLLLPLLLGHAAPAAADEPPVALAGVSFLAYPGEKIILDGSQSYDPEGYELAFAWEQVHGPRTELTGDDTPNPSFSPDVGGTYTFALVVDDGLQTSEPDEVDVVVVDPAIGSDGVEARGCAAAPAPAGLLLALGGLLGLARRRR